MKLSDAKHAKVSKPFVELKNPPLSIHVEANESGQITAFKASHNGHEKYFEVKNMNLLAAWKQLETFIKQTKK